jgi:phosphoglycerate dehydrogenase-like enzyme
MIASMKPTGVLVNVGRGAVVDEDALVDALTREKIKGAALDVTATEPLPAGHAVYALENCLMSFHCADLTEDYHELTMTTFIRHARAYVGEEEGDDVAWNVVSKEKGY